MAIKRKYELNQLYLGKHNNYVKIAYYDENSGRYVNVLIPNRTETYNKKFDEEFEVELPLEEVLKNENLEILITDSNGVKRTELSPVELNGLLVVLSKKKKLSPSLLQKQGLIAENIVNIICDLLGLNSENTPSTSFKFLKNFDINYSIIPAKKLQEFKKNLYAYIDAALMTEASFIVRYGQGVFDYRILRSLNKANIKQTDQMKQNSFLINASNDGRILINGIDINEYNKKQNNGFQKTIKF